MYKGKISARQRCSKLVKTRHPSGLWNY